MEKESFDDFIKELKQRNDLVSVASRYVQLERKGRYYWCRCPFHGEKTASLSINDIDGMFYCFGCHVGGTVIHFVQQMESLTFIEAVKLLAEWANMEIPESFSGNNGKNIENAKKRRDRLLSLMKDTAKHYHSNLSKPTAKLAVQYMNNRKLDDGLSTKFGLGYSDGYNELSDYLKTLGYTEQEMLSAGVLKKKDNRVYDPLANRLIFPIIDIYGNVIAFGGRTLDPHPDFAKYLNTADTELFNKRNTLYGINYLKKQKQHGPIPYIIVVEGYMDTISLHKAGFTTTIASMGTALTQEQAKMIKRFVDKVYICYDGDAPGQSATIRGLDILKDNGLDVMVVQLPDGYDPDDVIKNFGNEGYQKILDKSLPLTEFKIKFLKTKFDLKNVDGRAKYLSEVIDVLVQVKNDVEREAYVPMVGEIASINVDFIKQEIIKKLDGKSVENEIENKLKKVVKTTIKTDENDENNGKQKAIIKAEKYILYSLIHSKPFAHFKTDISYLFSGKRVYIYNLIMLKKNDYMDSELIENVFNEYGDEDKSIIADIINYGAESSESEENEKKYFIDCVLKVYVNYLNEKLKLLSDEYTAEIDNIKRKEISEKMKDISLKLKNKNLEEL
ncbi:MAG: DNA primase [Clostridia bacterium]|nr:DNA primase [Clostridia bacterium]